MFGIGTPELLVILVVALIVLGPKRLPEVARALGKGLAALRKATSGVTNDLERARWMLEEEIHTAERARVRPAAPAPGPEGRVDRQAPASPAQADANPPTTPPGPTIGTNDATSST